MGITLLVAGHETTVSMIGKCVLTLLRHPEHLAELRESPEKMEHAVEELLRMNPIGDGGPLRVTLEDVELGGTVIPKGSAVLAAICSANRDPDQFAEGSADEFDPARPSAASPPRSRPRCALLPGRGPRARRTPDRALLVAQPLP